MAQADFTRIATNIGALNALASLRTINSKLGIHQQRLSTGKRINSAADDPAGLTIATKMLARSEGLKVALDNIGDAKNMLSVAEAGLGKITDILVQMRSKAEQAASDTLGASERAAIQSQLQSFAEQIDNVVNETKWNGVKLLDGTVNKRFQTGADEGEHTLWQLTQEHTASVLRVSEAVTAAKTDLVNNVGSSFTGTGTTVAFTGLSPVTTGRYSVEILDRAAATDQGDVNRLSATLPSGVSGLSATSGALTGTQLGNGTFTLEITGGSSLGDRTNVNWRILNSEGSTVVSVTGDNWSGASVDLEDAVGTIGVTLAFSGGLQSGDILQFEYIQQGYAKYALKDGSGLAMTVDVDGSSGGATGAAGYFNASAPATVNTGRGITFNSAALGSLVAGDARTFDFKAAGNWIVDVSTAAKAAAYMTTVNNALDIVNSSMADLGSLMARLTFKEEAVSVAQVNVEASYNRIMNADMAFEQLEATKMSILQQTAITMLAQANTSPQAILGLFR